MGLCDSRPSRMLVVEALGTSAMQSPPGTKSTSQL
jgi:hypothetical protein